MSEAAPDEAAARKARKAARSAISELFLDTELDELSFRYLRDLLRESGLSIHELDEIYYDEVAPLLFWNTYAVAGVWAGFDSDDLDQRCEAERARPRRLLVVQKLRRYWVTRSTIDDWRRLRQLVLET